MPVALLLAATGCQDAVPPSAVSAASASRAVATRPSPGEGPSRYSADVTLRMQGAGVDIVGANAPKKRPPFERRMRIERERTPSGEWITTVDVTPAFSGVPYPAGAESRVIGRLQVNEATGAVVLLGRSGRPIESRPGFDPAGAAASGLSFGRWLEHAIVTPSQAARSLQSLRASLGDPAISGDTEVYRRAEGDHEVELMVDARTGLAREEVQREKGRIVMRTTHRYERAPDGQFVRAETRIEREDAEQGRSTYVVSLSNVAIDGASTSGRAP